MPRTKLTIAILCALTCVLWIIRLAAPDDLLDRDQERPASYLLDIVENGQWIVQTDAYGHVASKPPASLWVAAPAALLVDGAPRWVRTLPSFLGVLGTALLVWWIGRRGMGDWPGILAALLFLATPMAAKAVALVRTDAFFTFAVTLTACLAYRAWQDGKGWTGIWLAGTLATLTKGPQGLVFALGGLLAVRGSQTAPPRWRAWLPGVVLWILIAGGWLLAATFVLGDAVTDKMLGDELVGHVVEGDGGEIPGTRFWVPLLSILIHAAPWSLVLPVAAVWVWRRRHLDSNAVEHPAEYGDLLRFALFWLLVGLAVLALAGHQRRDLVMPMVPAAALLTSAWVASRPLFTSERAKGVLAAALTTLALVGTTHYYHVTYAQKPAVQATAGVKELAEHVAAIDRHFPVIHVDSRLAFQIELGRHGEPCTQTWALELCETKAACFLAVQNVEPWRNRPGFHVIQAWTGDGHPSQGIVGNRPELTWDNHMAGWNAPFQLWWFNLQPGDFDAETSRFVLKDKKGWLRVRNTSDQAAEFVALVETEAGVERIEERIEAGQAMRFNFGS